MTYHISMKEVGMIGLKCIKNKLFYNVFGLGEVPLLET